jgi:hypothetical protein
MPPKPSASMSGVSDLMTSTPPMIPDGKASKAIARPPPCGVDAFEAVSLTPS